jgi:hypothetical protein
VCRRIARLNREWEDTAGAFTPEAGELRLGDLLDRLYRSRMDDSDAQRWGDKTPGYVFHLPLISRIFPDCQFIHLIRDGRDVALSSMAKWHRRFPQRLYMDEQYLIRSWLRALSHGRSAGAALGPDRYVELKYEDLVLDPETRLGEICGFLGEDLHPDMLQHESLARRLVRSTGHVEVREPVFRASIQRWRREMSPEKLWEVERIAGPALEEMGYELSAAGSPSAAALVSLALKEARYVAVRSVQRALELGAFARLNRGKRRR